MSTTLPVTGLVVGADADRPSVEETFGFIDELDSLNIPIFSTLSVRSAEIPSPVEGQVCYVTETHRLYVHNGTSWVGAGPRVAIKTASTIRTSTTTPSADPHLTHYVEADSMYVSKLFILWSAGTTPDFKVSFSVPSGASHHHTLLCLARTTGGTVFHDVCMTGESVGYGGDGNSFNNESLWLMVQGNISVGATPGTASFDWSQNTSNSTSTFVFSGSWFSLEKVI